MRVTLVVVPILLLTGCGSRAAVQVGWVASCSDNGPTTGLVLVSVDARAHVHEGQRLQVINGSQICRMNVGRIMTGMAACRILDADAGLRVGAPVYRDAP